MTNSSKTDSQIAEILGLMEEKGKTKDWILDEMKLNRIKSSAKPSMNSHQILKKCPISFVSKILDSIKNGNFDTGDIKSLTKLYNWFFTDIIASANPETVTKEQVQKILALNNLIKISEIFKNTRDSSVILSTGDGMVIGFPESAEHPLLLAIDLHKSIKQYNKGRRGKEKLRIRIGLDVGPVFVLKDLNDQDTYWGPGIIMARRIMDLAGDMHIFASKKFGDDTRKLSNEYEEIFHHIGHYGIKHNEEVSIYNIYGNGFGNKSIPKKTKLVNRKETEKDFQAQKTFLFNEIQIELAVKNPKTMLTHHVWTWKIENISKNNVDEIFYFIDGDFPKDFSKMNVRVTDFKNKNLKILSVLKNKPLRKEFVVKLPKPVKPKQKTVVKMEYDWEEPDTSFFYKVPTICKKFQYKFSIPKGTDIKNRILKVDPDLGKKWIANPPSKVNYGAKFTTVIWKTENLKAYDAYNFEW